MDVWDELDAIEADETLTPEEKRQARLTVKADALADIINNGKPAPNPISPIVRTWFPLDVYRVFIHSAHHEEIGGLPALRLHIEVRTGNTTDSEGNPNGPMVVFPHEATYFVNPPVLTATKKKDLVETASEILLNEIRRRVG